MSRRSSNEETAPFLDVPEATIGLKELKGSAVRSLLKETVLAKCSTFTRATLLLNILLLFGNAIWCIANLQPKADSRTHSAHPHGGLYEPSEAPISLKNTTWDLPIGTRSPFTDLDPAVADAAWATVNMGGRQGWLKVSKSKMDAMGQESIEYSDGSGYLYGMDVFHQLHCLDFLRKKTIMYHHLYPDVEEDADIPLAYHIAHCIDSIRLSLQCHADLTLIPQRWADGWLEPWAVWTNQHQCRDFDSVVSWARESFPDLTLEHPELGRMVTGHLNHSALPIWDEPHDPLPDFMNHIPE